MSQRTPIRHGEILLRSRSPLQTPRENGKCAVVHRWAYESGHHHVLESDTVFAQIVAANGDLYVDLMPRRHCGITRPTNNTVNWQCRPGPGGDP